MKFIDHHTRSLNSTTAIAPKDLEKAHPNMGWFTNNIIKCNFADTTQLDKDFVYMYPLGHNLNSGYPYLNLAILNDKYANNTRFVYEP